MGISTEYLLQLERTSNNMSTPPPSIAPCAPYVSMPYSNYGYQPSLSAGIVFSIFFGLFCTANILQTFRTRAWWMGFFFSAGAGLETIGWIGRAVAHSCSYSQPISTMQIATLIMGPAYTQSGVYIAMWLIIKLIGRDVSPLPPTAYLLVVFFVDCVCLSLQAIGGGMAASAFSNGSSTDAGTTIMVVGIIAQLVSGCVFSVFLCIVLPRGASQIRKSENRPLLLACVAIVISNTMMILRGFYRSIELCQGWQGHLIINEIYIIVLDATPMLIAMGTLAVLNPCVLLKRIQERQATSGTLIDAERGEKLESSSQSDV